MRQPFESDSAWRGEALWKRPDSIRRLDARDIEVIDHALEQVKASHLPIESLKPDHFPLSHLKETMAVVAHHLEHGSGVCRLLGLPAERYTEAELRLIFWGLGVHIGRPVSQSAAGELIFNVRDEGWRMGHAKARGPNTSKGLHFHTDRSDVIGFLCRNQAKSGGENYLVSSIAVHNEIQARRPDLLEILYQPFHYIRHNVDTGNHRPYCLQPVFAVCQGHFVANVLRVLIERGHALPEVPDLTAGQKEALDFLDQVCAEPAMHVTFRQEPGDMLFINNFIVFHSRTAFEDYKEAERKRHLLRLWLSMPNSRPLPEAFAAHYGETRAGAMRGGMRKEEA